MANSKKSKKAYCLWLDSQWIPLMEARSKEEGVPPARPGRVGGVVEWIRRLIARELGIEFRLDPHEDQRENQTGQPNVHHPWLQGRPFGRAAARTKRDTADQDPSESPENDAE